MADKKISQLTGATTPLAGTEVLPIVQGGSTVKVSIANVTAGRSVATGPITASVADNGGISIVQSLAGETGFLNFVDSDAGLAGRVKYDHSNNSLQFISNAVEHVRIDSSGNVKNNLGNFIVGTAAKGVSFSENTPAAGMTSQLLNWYETGTFTPVLSCATPGTLAVTYNVQKGYYTRVGRVVHIWGNIQTDAVTVGTATGAVRLTGLPFTSAASSTAVETYMGSMGYQGITKAGFTDFNPQLQENTTYVLILASKSDGGGAANVQIGDLSAGTNLLYWQVTYVAA